MAAPATLRLVRGRGLPDWIFADPAAKLGWRASLPGAFGFDAAAHELRLLAAAGIAAEHALALALPASWMVNSKATSPVFRAWLTPEGKDAWLALLDCVGDAMSIEECLGAGEVRDHAAAAVTALAGVGAGASLCAVSKVLALFRPQLVPLMDDAALAFWLGKRDELPEEPDAASPRAPAELFLPAMDAFVRGVRALEGDLVRLAASHEAAVIDGAQALDRLVWVDSWGYRHDPELVWVRDVGAEYIVRLPGHRGGQGPVDVDDLPDGELAAARRAAGLGPSGSPAP